MGMMLNDPEQKLLYKLIIEELKSYGFDDNGVQVAGKVRPSDLLYVKLLLSSLERVKKSVKREHARKVRIEATMDRINQTSIENSSQGEE